MRTKAFRDKRVGVLCPSFETRGRIVSWHGNPPPPSPDSWPSAELVFQIYNG